MFQTLLDLGASPNYKDLQGLTPIYHGILNKANALCIQMLLHDRAEIGIRDREGLTEVHQVASNLLCAQWCVYTCTIFYLF